MSEQHEKYHAGSDPAPLEFTIQSESEGPDRTHKIILGPLVYATARNIDAALALVHLANVGQASEQEPSRFTMDEIDRAMVAAGVSLQARTLVIEALGDIGE